MIERWKGRVSFQCDTSCAKDLELAFKLVAYANELGSLTRTSVEADQAAVHTLLEAREDHIIARFRGLYAKANIVRTKWDLLFEWKGFAFTSIDNTLTKISNKQTTGSPTPFVRGIRKTLFAPLGEASIKALSSTHANPSTDASKAGDNCGSAGLKSHSV